MSSFVILCILAIFSTPPFEVTLAPDQVLPITYTNEPLIVSVSGPPNTPFDMLITIAKPDGETLTQLQPNKPSTYLNGKFWVTVADLPANRGYFISNISIKYKNEMHNWEIPFCRMDRNTDKAIAPPFVLHNPDGAGLYLAQMQGIKEVSFDSTFPNLVEQVKKAISFGCRVTIVFDVNKNPSPIDIFEDLNSKLGELVSVWEIAGNYTSEQLINFFARVRKTKGIAVFRASISNIETLPEILYSVPEEIINEVSWCGHSFTVEDLKQLRDTIFLHRGEGTPFSLRFNSENISSNPVEQIQQIWIAKYAGARTITLPYSILVKDGNISQLFSFLCGTTRVWTDGVEPLGWYSRSETTNAFVYYALSHWIMIFWGTGSLNFSGEGLATTQFFDSYGNPSTLPQINDNTLVLDDKPSPQYLIGNAYEVLYATAVNELKSIAGEMNRNEFSFLRTPVISEALKVIAQDPKNNQNRVHVLNLFRELPHLEGQKFDTYEAQAQKRLFIAKLSNFLRCVCITEQYRGEPFREPLLDILTRSEERITEYLTGSSSSSEKDYRANWILEEVHQLIDRAGKITSNGKRIEAVGLAYLAESRAQSLEFLRQNPMTNDINKATPPATTVIAKKEETTTPPSVPPPTPIKPAKPETSQVPKEEGTILKPTGPLEHTVKRGETISSICKLYGITEDEFCSWNGVRKGATLKAGKVYKIQIARKQKEEEAKPITSSTSTPTPTPKWEGTEYIVQAGDYPGLIAKKLGVTTAELLKTNDLTEKSKLKIGQKLKVPGAKPQEGEKAAEPSTPKKEEIAEKALAKHPTSISTPETDNTVQETSTTEEIQIYKLNPGDTPAVISKKFGISVQKLMEYNNIKDPTKLRAGQELKIPSPKSEKTQKQSIEKKEQKEQTTETKPGEEQKNSEPLIHTVEKGDNPYIISKKYGISLNALLEANQLTSQSTLQIGQKLIIPPTKKKP
ncbi:MAG: LysM peptidoglycan-binding domain-containing protein [Candidatus Hydrogenedens sp.]